MENNSEVVSTEENRGKNKLSSFGVLFNKSSDILFSKNFWRLLGVIFLPFIPLVVVIAIVMVIFMASGLKILAIIFGAIFALGFFYFAFWMKAALITAVNRVVHGEAFGIREVYKNSRKKTGPLAGSDLLVLCIVLGCYIPALVVGLVGGMTVGILVLILMMFPAVYFGILFSKNKYIVICEDLGAVASIKRSKLYVKKYFWQVLGRFALISLGIVFVTLAIAFITHVMPVVGIILRFGFNAIMAPFIVIFDFLIYLELKKFHDHQ